ncbi:hypothetical protein BGZ68_008009 [Mortierella alpina]|nr:hypothetical protein BGZ68_008009 [Mortierella alpina]
MRSENATKKLVNGMNNRDRSNTAMSHSTVVDLSHLEPSAPQKPTRQEEEIVILPREGGSPSSSMSTKGPTQLKELTPAPAQLKEVTPAPAQLKEVAPALPKTGELPPSSMSTEETTGPAEITEIIPEKTSMQVYFKDEQNKYTSHNKQLNPISLKSSRGFEVSVSTGSLLAGWYWAVFQVSLKDMPDNVLSNIMNITFDVKSTTTTCTEHAFTSTVVMKDEIAAIPRTKPEPVRLRLHRQVEVSPTTDLSISITVETLPAFKEEVSFDLHYFELTLPNVRRETDVEDHVLWGEGRPDQFIRIGVEDPEFEKESVAIEAYDISDNGKLAVTVYFTQNTTSDVLATKSTSATKTTLGTKKPPATKNDAAKNVPAASSALASESVPAAESVHPAQSAATAPPTGFASTAGAASSTGNAYTYDCSHEPTLTGDLGVAYTYRKAVNGPRDLGGQFTYDAATSNFQGLTKPSPLSPLGVAHIDVWDLSAPSGPPSTTNPPGLVKPFARGSFIVPALKGAVSIWDFEMGKIISSIPIPEDKRGVGAALSEDGYMVAISVNGRIQVHDVASGIKLRCREAHWKEDNDLEMIFRREYFMALDAKKPTSGNKHINARSVFRVRDMEIVRTRNVFWQYKTEFSSTWDPIFAYQQGSILNIKRLGDVLSPADVNGCGPDKACEFQSTKLNLNNNSWVDHKNTVRRGTTFNLENTLAYSCTFNIRKLKIVVGDNSAMLSLGPASEHHHNSGFFMAYSSQLVLVSNGFLQVWRLPSTSNLDYELLHVEACIAPSEGHANDICMTKVSSVLACTHGRKFKIAMEPIQCLPGSKKDEANDAPAMGVANDVSAMGLANDVSAMDVANVADDASTKDEVKEKITSNGSQLLTFPMTTDRMFSTTEKYRYNSGIASLIETYANSDEVIKKAITGFLLDRIRPSSKYSSSLVILCRSWKDAYQAIFEKLLVKLLPADDRHTWIPDIKAAKKEDPLSILMKTAKKSSSVIGACRIIMDYCVDHAILSRNLSFLSPFLRNLKKIVALFPDEARRYLVKIARIRVDERRRQYVVENIIVSYPPWHYILFWKTPSKIKDHVMQLPVRAERQSVLSRWRKYFIQKLVAFSLYQYNYLGITVLSLDRIKDLTMQFPASSKRPRDKVDAATRPIFVATFDALWHFKDIDDCKEEDSGDTLIEQESTTLQGLTVEQERMRKEVLKMESEMMKKKSARKLALTKKLAAPEQEGAVKLAGPITQQTTWWKTLYHIFKLKLHLKTHNYVTRHNFELDFFENPAIAALVEYKCAALLQVYHENVSRSQIIGVFVAIIVMGVVFLWLELLQAINNFDRYKRTMYNLVDIIAYSLPIAASANMLVVLYNNNPVGNTRIVSFSVLAIFHHMGGRYEPVQDELVSEDWGFQFMIGVFFFFTVIVMLNVLIALINKAFGKGDNAWRLDWIEARLHYIETAENFSYHVPGFRETYNCFPKEIYFFSKAQEEKIRASEKKVEESAKIDAEKEQLKTLMQELKDQLASVQELKTQLASVQESLQKR